MRKRLTITIDEVIYDGLYQLVGKQNISQFIESLLRPHVVLDNELEAAYKMMAEDEIREKEAAEWAEGTVGDVADESR